MSLLNDPSPANAPCLGMLAISDMFLLAWPPGGSTAPLSSSFAMSSPGSEQPAANRSPALRSSFMTAGVQSADRPGSA